MPILLFINEEDLLKLNMSQQETIYSILRERLSKNIDKLRKLIKTVSFNFEHLDPNKTEVI
jgi:hypothetical protein